MAVGKKPAAAAPLKGKKKPATFVIDCAKPVEDKIMKIGEFEKFLVDKIKVDNKVGACTCCTAPPLAGHTYAVLSCADAPMSACVSDDAFATLPLHLGVQSTLTGSRGLQECWATM